MPKVVVVVPSCRPQQMGEFRRHWKELFRKHKVKLITVWDGELLRVETDDYADASPVTGHTEKNIHFVLGDAHQNKCALFCRHSDVCRNLGFVEAAKEMKSPDDVLVTFDDDVRPVNNDPIQEHLDTLGKKVSIDWMNTAMGELFLRGVPYQVRNQATVMVSHGVWCGVPDFDGETQLKLEHKLRDDEDNPGMPYCLPYFEGPIPKGALFPICGMNLAVKRDALPFLYFAPMGADSGFPDLHRFGDIWMGLSLKTESDARDWAIYTGASTVLHDRASNAAVNYEKEKFGRAWNEVIWKISNDDRLRVILSITPDSQADYPGLYHYWKTWGMKANAFAELISATFASDTAEKTRTR